jgi:hypothetical protein
VIDRRSILDPEIRECSAADYPTLADEVPYELAEFDELFAVVTGYFLDLPWRTE